MKRYFFVERSQDIPFAFSISSDISKENFITNSDSVKELLKLIDINVSRRTDNIKYSEIYFFCKCWKLKMFKKIQKLSKNNTVYYYQREPYTAIPSVSFKSRFLKFFVSVIYDLDVVITKEADVDVVQLSDNFFSKNNIKTIYENLNSKNETIKSKLEPLVGNNRILVLLSDLSFYGWISEKRFLEFNKMLRSILKGKDYLVKFHPNDKRTSFGYSSEQTIPSYIPAEYLFNFNWNLVIGIESYSLVLAGNNPTVVSCLDMLDFPEKVNKDCHRFLENETNHIVFPKDRTEFESIVVEATK